MAVLNTLRYSASAGADIPHDERTPRCEPKTASVTRILIVVCVVLSACGVQPASRVATTGITENDYAAAEKRISHHLGELVKNEKPVAHWLGTGEQFWYEREGDSGPEYVLVNSATGEKQAGYQPKPLEGQPASIPGMLASPNGIWSAFAREHNLWVKDNESGEEQPLTTDGAPYFSYGGSPDQFRRAALQAGTDFPSPLANSHWSPDGRRLIVGRLDERQVSEYSFLESVPPNGSSRARAYDVRIPLLGDPGQRLTETFVFDVAAGESLALELPAGFTLGFFSTGNKPIAWSADSSIAYFLAATQGDKNVRLLEVNVSTGDTRTVLEEWSETSVNLGHNYRAGPNVRVLGKTQELIWHSERNGWGHLYLYDLESGAIRNQITDGAWAVGDIVHVDRNERVVYFTAGGREPDSDPYFRKLYRASFDGTDIRLLTPEEADHDIQSDFSPSGKYFVETYSTVDTPPRLLLRSLEDGDVIAELEIADAVNLYAADWRAPERFSVKAADGVSDIWVAVYLPPNSEPQRSYPIIDAIYGGPVSAIAPRSFRQSYASGYQQASLARLGFIVVSIDGRGTPYRSRSFREVGYGNFADPQLEDHIAAIRQIAKRYPSADLDRVGIYGHSNGGYMAARALLRHPDFFTVGVASAGPHNFQGLPGTGMPWMGIPQYEGGATIRPNDAAVPDNYRVLDNANFASGLKGKLLLICGDMDNTAFPALTLQLADALAKANKSYDLLFMPNKTHRYFVEQPYVMRRVWDYFVEHLLGEEPPLNFAMKDYETLVYQ